MPSPSAILQERDFLAAAAKILARSGNHHCDDPLALARETLAAVGLLEITTWPQLLVRLEDLERLGLDPWQCEMIRATAAVLHPGVNHRMAGRRRD